MIHKDIWDNIGIPMDSESIDMVSDHIESMEKILLHALDALKLARAYVVMAEATGTRKSVEDLGRIDEVIIALEQTR